MTVKGFAGVLPVVMLSTFLGACSDGSDNFSGIGQGEPFAELYARGITRYLGAYTPMLAESDGDLVSYFFGEGDGPLCLEGGQYSMSTISAGSENLLIFLEGGGACWSDFCSAIPEAFADVPLGGIRDPERADNPVKSWNQVYVPYCDGSLHAGDRDLDDDSDGQIDRYHRGLHNLSAALDVATSTFPNPRRIVLAGNSGGGFGTIFALPLVRYLYPDIPIDVVNDSGVGVGRPGEPEFLMQLIHEWGAEAFIPPGCPDCIGADGHLTGFLIWQMEQDNNARLALLSYTQDALLEEAFLQIGGPAFEAALLEEIPQQENAHPGRVHSFIPVGDGHTFVQIEPDKAVDGVSVMQWLDNMLYSPELWQSLTEVDDAP